MRLRPEISDLLKYLFKENKTDKLSSELVKLNEILDKIKRIMNLAKETD
ncbi:MAG: hypothetical protein U5L76_05360 [Patescibacteria group bacterium]|nr:hypothetical protein [Patescibacteria group bacterium]